MSQVALYLPTTRAPLTRQSVAGHVKRGPYRVHIHTSMHPNNTSVTFLKARLRQQRTTVVILATPAIRGATQLTSTKCMRDATWTCVVSSLPVL